MASQSNSKAARIFSSLTESYYQMDGEPEPRPQEIEDESADEEEEEVNPEEVVTVVSVDETPAVEDAPKPEEEAVLEVSNEEVEPSKNPACGVDCQGGGCIIS